MENENNNYQGLPPEARNELIVRGVMVNPSTMEPVSTPSTRLNRSSNTIINTTKLTSATYPSCTV